MSSDEDVVATRAPVPKSRASASAGASAAGASHGPSCVWGECLVAGPVDLVQIGIRAYPKFECKRCNKGRDHLTKDTRNQLHSDKF